MRIDIFSFGYKHGMPTDANFVTDVRFLANPYYDRKLKPLTGEDEDVEKYVLGNHAAGKFLEKYLDLLDYLAPLYKKELACWTIAVGCTGGKHRSVVIARAIFRHFEKKGTPVRLSHRDIGK